MFVDPDLTSVVAFVGGSVDDVMCCCAKIWFVACCSSFLDENDVVVGLVELFLKDCGSCVELFALVMAFVEGENVGCCYF